MPDIVLNDFAPCLEKMFLPFSVGCNASFVSLNSSMRNEFRSPSSIDSIITGRVILKDLANFL